MKLENINIRDPYVLKANNKYYMYGTRSETAWGNGTGFDCYVSEDLKFWEGPYEIFHRPEGFFADKEYWAPECLYRNGYYYLVATLGADDVPIGCYALRAKNPIGPFEPYSERLTPDGMRCLDGTVYTDESDITYLIYSNSFENKDKRGSGMDAIQLSADLSHSVGEAFRLFDVADAGWARPFPYAKEEFGMEGEVYFTDGPCLLKAENGKLCMTWSSWGQENEYAVGLAVSENGTLRGPWKHTEQPLFPRDGGHGMFFTGYDGTLYFTLHYPNQRSKEHPVFFRVKAKNEKIIFEK